MKYRINEFMLKSNPVLIFTLKFFYKKEHTFDKVTNTFSMFVKIYDFLRLRSAVQLGLIAVIRNRTQIFTFIS